MSRHSNLLVTTSGFCNQLEKVCFDTSAGDRIFGAKNQLSQLRNISHRMKIQKVKTKCQNLLTEPETSILELTKVIGLLTSTIQPVLQGRLQCRYLQLQQISSLRESHSYQQKIVLDHQSKTELLWWITNLDLCNGRSLIQRPAQVLIQTDASKKGWGATCNGISTGGMWSAQEMKYHINILELLAVKLAI